VIVPDAPMVPARWRVLARRERTAEVVTLTVAPERDVDRLPVPRPGQFSMLSAGGVHEVPISFSGLDAAAGPDGAVEHTIRAVGSATAALCELAPGDALGVRGPFGTAWDLDAAEGGDVVVMAGGIGLAPLRPVVELLVAHRGAFGVVSVLVGARSPAEVLFGEDLARWATATGVAVEVTVDSAPRGWRGHVGVVTQLLDDVELSGRSTAFVCGPEPMMRFGARALVAHGVDPDRIQLSAERNMRCAVGHCGHCQLGPHLVCRDGPVLTFPRLAALLEVRER